MLSSQRDVTCYKKGYKKGFEAGLKAFAWWKNGVEYLGTTGAELKEALSRIKEVWNYNDKPEFPETLPRVNEVDKDENYQEWT